MQESLQKSHHERIHDRVSKFIEVQCKDADQQNTFFLPKFMPEILEQHYYRKFVWAIESYNEAVRDLYHRIYDENPAIYEKDLAWQKYIADGLAKQDPDILEYEEDQKLKKEYVERRKKEAELFLQKYQQESKYV